MWSKKQKQSSIDSVQTEPLQGLVSGGVYRHHSLDLKRVAAENACATKQLDEEIFVPMPCMYVEGWQGQEAFH